MGSAGIVAEKLTVNRRKKELLLKVAVVVALDVDTWNTMIFEDKS